jgi:hypothetical protein
LFSRLLERDEKHLGVLVHLRRKEVAVKWLKMEMVFARRDL